MSDSQRLHAHLMSLLQPVLAAEDFRNVETLAWAMTGVLLQKTIQLPAWTTCLPDETEAATRERRFRRWLQTAWVQPQHWYAPFIRQALTTWDRQSLYVALDTTSVAGQLVILRTALIYRGRAVPLAWQVFKRKSVMLAFDQYAPLVQWTAHLLPRRATVILLGDRGFRDLELMRLARQLRWHFRLRLAENEYVWAKGRRQRLDSLALAPYTPRFLQRVRVTDQRYGPVNVALVWDGDPAHDPWRVVSDERATLHTLTDYARRMGIDLGFLDDKSAGFQLDDTELRQPQRLDHLLLIMALCTLYLTAIGTQVVATHQRHLVDAHWQRGLSYFQLGWRWLDYSLAREVPLPTTLALDPRPDPEPVSAVNAKQFQAQK